MSSDSPSTSWFRDDCMSTFSRLAKATPTRAASPTNNYNISMTQVNDNLSTNRNLQNIAANLIKEHVLKRQWSCGKVMFSQACVYPQGVYMPDPSFLGGSWVWLVPSPLSLLDGRVCLVHLLKVHSPWEVHTQKVHIPPWKVHPLVPTSNGGHRSGRYASYWNEFFFTIDITR